MPSKEENENESKNEKKNENENYKTLIIMKELNDGLDEIIDKSKSFEDQIKLIKKQKIEMSFILSTVMAIKKQNFKTKACTLVKYH